MNENQEKLNNLIKNLNKAKDNLIFKLNENNKSIHVYTHIDADGLSAGAILGKSFYREHYPFQITCLKQLEREEIEKISNYIRKEDQFLIFSDFGSGQYLELEKELIINKNFKSFLILDHHLPQKVSDKEDLDLIKNIYKKTHKWHVNPYFFDINGSKEISGAGLCYYFVKCLNQKNIDLSQIAIIGATGDLQNHGPNKSFKGINELILKDAIEHDLIEVKDDLNFSTVRPLNEAIAYSKDIELPGLTNDTNKSLIFLQSLGIFLENSAGKIKSFENSKAS